MSRDAATGEGHSVFFRIGNEIISGFDSPASRKLNNSNHGNQMKRLAIHGMWTARQAIYRAYDRHCEGGGLGLLSPAMGFTGLVCLAAAPWHPGQLLVAVPLLLLAFAARPKRKEAEK